MTYLSNRLSLSMLPDNAKSIIEPVEITEILQSNFESIVDDEDTAIVMGDKLKMKIEYNPISILLTPEDTLYVARLMGGQDYEGYAVLPYCTVKSFIKVTIKE